MMTQAFYTGISGLKSNQTAIDIASDNLANTNSPGFKGYSAEFSSLFEQTLAAVGTTSLSNDTSGVGTNVNATVMDLSQGSMLLSDISTDLAVEGDGWFGLAGNNETFYTRTGNFSFDVNNDLVSADDSLYVLGTMGNNISNGVLTNVIDSIPLGDIGTEEKLTFPKSLISPPQPTTDVKVLGNIGINDQQTVVGASVVDAQNNKNKLTLTFTKSAVQNALGTRWDVNATTKSLLGDTLYDTQSGIVEFDERGAITISTLSSINNNGSSVTLDLGTDFTGVTAMDNVPVSMSSAANGTIGGELQGYDINQNAEVIATFTNGVQSSVGKVALFHFQNDQGLERITGTRYQQSSNSGNPLFIKDANGNNILGASVLNFKLEGSNVKLESGLTDLIILQRSYDANSKSITTADQMMQKALNMDA